MNRHVILVALAVLWQASTAALHATWMVPLSLETLTANADVVVQGQVLVKTCQRDPEGRIYTAVQLQVTEVWKGTLATNQIMVVHGGGVLGEEGQGVAGQVTFEAGESVVVFLVLNPKGELVCLGLSQGKFVVKPDAITGELRARNPFHHEVPAASGTSKAGLAATPPAPLTLARLKQIVQAGQPAKGNR